MSVNVVLVRDRRGLGAKGDLYPCPNGEVAEKLIRLGHAVAEGESVPADPADVSPEPVSEVSDDSASPADVDDDPEGEDE